MIPAIILAAGRSSRMGRSKALLTLPDGATFVRQLASTLLEGGVADVLIVARPDDLPLRAEVERFGRARVVENPRADEGQLSSLIAGLNAADRPGVQAVLIMPVDVPLVAPATIRSLIDAFTAARAPIARAAHEGRHGHPAIFARSMFDALRHADPAVGAKAVVRSHLQDILNVEVSDPWVVRDIDTPEDYDLITRG